MPDRIIRDELLTSERYWSVGIEAQRLFVHLLLNADALGRFSGKNYTIRAACYPGHAIDPKLVEKLLSDLHDADLVRIYEHEGARYLFIPRYRQRLRAKCSFFPAPPSAINDIHYEKADSSQTQVGLESAEGREGKGVEGREGSKSARARRHEIPLPEGFCASPRVVAWAEKRGIENLDLHVEHFIGRATAKGYRYVNWDQALMNAVRDDWAKIGDGRKRVAI